MTTRILLTTLYCLAFLLQINSQDLKNKAASAVKNLIVLIPDGTSIDVLALSRWYKGNKALAVDSLICGLVKTYCADRRFPDSAPAGTAYSTGHKSCKKHIGIDCNEKPFITILEYARLLKKSTGIAVTCEFTNATPADFVCHHNDRNDAETLARQFIHNSPTLVFAGGKAVLDKHNLTSLLPEERIRLLTDKKSFSELKTVNEDERIWALFSDWKGDSEYKSFECDRKPDEPSLSEMTAKAIELLSQDPDGFFLMVEGSQIDWACHNNDPYAAITDFIEFDKAVAVALEFARKNKNTAVVVVPDHGNGGISLGNRRSSPGLGWKNPDSYDYIEIDKRIAEPLQKARASARKIAELIIRDRNYLHPDTIRKYYNLNHPDSFVNKAKAILANPNIKEKKIVDTLMMSLGLQFSNENFIGWTTGGHSAEDVFLAVYVPQSVKKICGVVENDEVGRYLFSLLGDNSTFASLNQYYTEHTKLFKSDEIISIDAEKLIVYRKGKQTEYFANTNKAISMIAGKKEEKRLKGLIVRFKDEKGSWNYYLPQAE